MGISPTLNIPQARFLAMQHKFKAYVAGFGSGKTWVGCGGICKGMWEHPKINQGYFAPTYPQIRDIFYCWWTNSGSAASTSKVLRIASTLPAQWGVSYSTSCQPWPRWRGS